MAHMAGNEPNFDISSKKYDVQKTVPQKYKTAWALGLKVGMGKKSYYCHLSIEVLYHILSLVILLQFPAIVR